MSDPKTITRRSVSRGAAWTVPLVAVAVAAPAYAASVRPPQVDGNSEGGKCPGQSTQYEYGFIIPIEVTGPTDSLTITNITYNGTLLTPADFCLAKAKADGTLYVISFDSTSSANGNGSGTFDYTIVANGQTYFYTGATISYQGTPPIPQKVRQESCLAAGNCVD